MKTGTCLDKFILSLKTPSNAKKQLSISQFYGYHCKYCNTVLLFMKISILRKCRIKICLARAALRYSFTVVPEYSNIYFL